MRDKRTRRRIAGALIGLLGLLAWPGAAPAAGFPFQAWPEPGAGASQPREVRLLQEARRPWKLCVILPNLRDAYWSLVRYGIEEQSRALGLELTLIEASGYDALQQQISLIEKRCLGRVHDALILAAVDHSALNPSVRAARQAGLAVIDLINGISAPEIDARVAVNYGDLAYDLGRYMVAHSPGGRVVWSPGPEGSEWTWDASAGFKRALEGSSLTLVHSYRAAPFVREQRSRLQELAEHYRFDRVAGTAVTAEAAVTLGPALGAGVEVYSYYYSPKIHRMIRCGQVQAAVYEYPALQGRVAVDQAVRVLERRPFDFQLATDRLLLTADNLAQILDPMQMPPELIRELSGARCDGTGR